MMFSQDELASHFSFQYEETVRFCVCKYDTMPGGFICNSDEPKSELARDLGDRLQSRTVPFGTSDDL